MDMKKLRTLIWGIACLSLLLCTQAKAAITCITCPAGASADAFTQIVSITDADSGLDYPSGSTVQGCRRIIVHTAAQFAGSPFSGFILHSATMFVKQGAGAEVNMG